MPAVTAYHKIRFAHIPKDGESGVSFAVSGNSVVFRKGKAAVAYVYASASRGGVELSLTISSLEGFGSMSSWVQVAPGLKAKWDGGSGRCYDLWYDGSSDIDSQFVYVISAGGETFRGPIRVVTVEDGEQGLTGRTGAFPTPPVLWDSYPVGYVFLDGISYPSPSTQVAERVDIVYLLNSAAGAKRRVSSYRCIKSYKKTAASLSPDKDTTHWQLFVQEVRSMATDMLLADSAYIELLSTNGIRIYSVSESVDAEGNTSVTRRNVGEISGTTEKGNSHIIWMGNSYTPPGYGGLTQAEIDKLTDAQRAELTDPDYEIRPRWAVDEVGRHSIGGLSGQRIELDPVSMAVCVFDSSGAQCATISGERISSPISIFGEASGNLTPSSDSAAMRARRKGSVKKANSASDGTEKQFYVKSEPLNTPVKTTTPATIKVDAWLSTSRYIGKNASDADGFQLVAFAQVNLSLVVETYAKYEDGVLSDLIASTTVAAIYGTSTEVLSGASVRVRQPGFQVLRIIYHMAFAGTGTWAQVQWGKTSATTELSAVFATDAFQTYIHRSGTTWGRSALNYATIYSHDDNSGAGQMRLFITNDRYGMDVSQYGIRHRFAGSTKWQMLPRMLIRGILNTANTTANAELSNRLGLDYDDQVTYTRLATGAVQVKFSAAMQSALGLTDSNAKALLSIRATPYGGDTVTFANDKASCILNKATLANIKASGFVLMLSDDDSANDGECLLEISMTGYPTDGDSLVPAQEVRNITYNHL